MWSRFAIVSCTKPKTTTHFSGVFNASYCVLDETGRVILEQKVSTRAEALQAAFGAILTCSASTWVVPSQLQSQPPWVRERAKAGHPPPGPCVTLDTVTGILGRAHPPFQPRGTWANAISVRAM
jgi:hypothetical protein